VLLDAPSSSIPAPVVTTGYLLELTGIQAESPSGLAPQAGQQDEAAFSPGALPNFGELSPILRRGNSRSLRHTSLGVRHAARRSLLAGSPPQIVQHRLIMPSAEALVGAALVFAGAAGVSRGRGVSSTHGLRGDDPGRADLAAPAAHVAVA
jgi:hypothetical protein